MKDIIFNEDLGYSVIGDTLGEAWIGAVECVSKNGAYEADESRNRLALQNFRIHSKTQILPDEIINTYAKAENVEAMKRLVFAVDTMKDFDIVTNFRAGAKSYKKRLEDSELIEFVVDRLTKIPESKKAVMVFPTKEDYVQVKNSPYNDYLPCIVSIQFRLRPEKNGTRKLNTIMNMRSWNIDQKGAGDLVIASMLNHIICEKLSQNLNLNIVSGTLDTFVTDIHIYANTQDDAQDVVSQYNTKIANEKIAATKLKKAGAVIIKDKQVLYVKKDKFPYFILPGGRLEAGESAEDALSREMLEELSTTVSVKKSLGKIEGKGASEKNNDPLDMVIELFEVSPSNNLVLNSELVDMKFLNSKNLDYNQMTPIGLKTIEYLKNLNLIE